MTCINKNIKELLAEYVNGEIGPAARDQVEAHLKTCEDCRVELALLRTMAEEPVPDPGEAFWASMPGRIYREVQKEQSVKHEHQGTGLRDFLERLRMPRLAWAVAVVVLVSTVSWITFYSSQEYAPRTATTGQDQLPLEDMFDSVEVAGLDSSELKELASWADTAMADIGDQTENFAMSSPDTGIYEELADLNPGEMERLSNLIETEEPEA